MTDSTPTEENKEDEIRSSISDYPSFDKWLHWVRSDNEWVGEVLKKRQHWTYISVYAIFEKEEGYGAYGVVLRNALAKPLVASAKFSENGKSFFHQAFLGIKSNLLRNINCLISSISSVIRLRLQLSFMIQFTALTIKAERRAPTKIFAGVVRLLFLVTRVAIGCWFPLSWNLAKKKL